MTNQKEIGKQELLKSQMFHFIECVLSEADSQGKLDYIDIKISNHQGNLQMERTLKDRRKAY